jgi:DNA modification methylase
MLELFGAPQGTGHWHGDRKQSTVWMIEHLKSDTGHGTQKPVECMKRPIENNSVAGDAVYEPFSGSGTTIIACEMTGRSCRALELNPGLRRRGREALAGIHRQAGGASATRETNNCRPDLVASRWKAS